VRANSLIAALGRGRYDAIVLYLSAGLLRWDLACGGLLGSRHVGRITLISLCLVRLRGVLSQSLPVLARIVSRSASSSGNRDRGTTRSLIGTGSVCARSEHQQSCPGSHWASARRCDAAIPGRIGYYDAGRWLDRRDWASLWPQQLAFSSEFIWHARPHCSIP